MGGAATEAAGAEVVAVGVDIMGVTMGAIMAAIPRVMEVVGVIIMDISFPESSVMAIVLMPPKAAAIHVIQG